MIITINPCQNRLSLIQCPVRGRAVAARQAHNLEAVGANPTPATDIKF